MKRLALALLLTACGPAQDAAHSFDSKKGLVAEYGAEGCTSFRCGDVVYTLPEFPVHRCHWQCGNHGGEWEQVLVEFHAEDGCYVEPKVTTAACWEEM